MCTQVKEVCRLVAARSASLAAAAIAGLLRQVWASRKSSFQLHVFCLSTSLPCLLLRLMRAASDAEGTDHP